MPLHSILIASHNRLDYLYRTVLSCLASTEHDFELLIFDDASDVPDADQFFADIAALDPRIIVFRDRTNKGVGYRFNQLHNHANGLVLHVLGSDDLLHPSRLVHAYSDLITYPNKNAIWCSPSIQLDANYNKLSARSPCNSPLLLKSYLFFQPYIQHPTVSYFNLHVSGLANYNCDYRAALDYRFYVDNFFNSVFHYSPLPLTYLVHSSHGITRSPSTRKLQLFNHDLILFDLWSSFFDVSFHDVAALRATAVTPEFSNSKYSFHASLLASMQLHDLFLDAITSRSPHLQHLYELLRSCSSSSDLSVTSVAHQVRSIFLQSRSRLIELSSRS